ncbi:FN3 domain-containing metallophosphoesterase family protein [Clostridium estertheticum]|uniref:Metallophosphoesterase n=1 Tax=Clostridium estertheticum TaxID=238834 RepID=A0AA47EEM8_9CLOT|nr:FN3 domain-containing metallophosphoesterase family protein [Clostridium estertheticum]MBU3154982.1 metallophosphoesterase [Clostridium estertheticum]WAG58801.1 metallophosphoesterase [Clostridium estertheticum]
MKKVKKIGVLSSLIAFIFVFTLATNGIFGSNSKTTIALAAGVDTTITDIALTPGSDPTQLNFAWYSANSTTSSLVQVALKSDMSGSTFPIDKAVNFKGTSTAGNEGHFSNKVTATGFKESTAYVYRLGDGTNWSTVNNYTTHSTSQYSILVAGDPQIGASGSVASDGAGWVDTMNKASLKFPNASFLLSVGDQVNNGKEVADATTKKEINESEYTQYFRPTQFTSLPIAVIAGNHETYGDGHLSHFNVPNMSTTYGTVAGSGSVIGTTGGDSYFTYGNTLYLMLNSNNVSEDGHMAFMKSAIAANPNAKWKVVSMHHSVYSSADHETDADIITRRTILPAMFDKLGIDVVLDGHDHCYTRTNQMLGGVSQKTTTDANGAVVNPKGTLYMTFNSASGSKYYEMQSPNLNGTYEAVKQQIHVPTISLMSVTNNALTISTYRTDTMAQTDTYTIAKAPTTNYDAMANGTVLIGTKAFALDYANDPLNAQEINNAVVGGGAIYVKNFSSNWIDNLTGLASMPK